MYAYIWNPNTGGFRLTTEKLIVSKEPRPVYARELDILGFDKHFKYDPQMDVPYMWAEANNYWYRGRQIAKTVGGSLYTPPKLEILDAEDIETLQPVDIDAMVEENAEIFKALIQATIKRIYDTYKRYRNKVDIFYVSYSGGKDSEVTLELVQRALPHNEFVVLFGDTGMEFPDTYEAVLIAEQKCKSLGLDFFRAKSNFNPHETWKIFGSPSTTIRWCCSVHKTAPQIIKLREVVGKSSFSSMSFIGVRRDESIRRSEYDYISYGAKHNKQYTFAPILEWSSLEIYLYLYSSNIHINSCYKKGISRAGCLVCPMTPEKSDFFRCVNYRSEVNEYYSIMDKMIIKPFNSENEKQRFFEMGGWKQRRNALDIDIGQTNYIESEKENQIKLTINNLRDDWKEWIKTVGQLSSQNNSNLVRINNNVIEFDLQYNVSGYSIRMDIFNIRKEVVTLLKQVFRKSAVCIYCKECEAECPFGFIKMDNGKLSIDERCIKCGGCHQPELGCLLYYSHQIPKGDSMKTQKSVDRYYDFPPRKEWIVEFFSNPTSFLDNNNLGSGMIKSFIRFLNDVNLIESKIRKYIPSDICNFLCFIGLDNSSTWAIMLINCSYTQEINWCIKKLKYNIVYTKSMIIENVFADYPSLKLNKEPNKVPNRVCSTFKQFCSLPFGTKLGLGKVTEEGKETYFQRGTWVDPEPLVILYALYKFAVACGDYYEFTLTRLLDHDIDSDGVSPTEIFCLDRETMVPILKGLAINYPEFISVTFTHDLDAISLNREKAPIDVLRLIAGGQTDRG